MEHLETLAAWGVNAVVIAAAWGAMRQKVQDMSESIAELKRLMANGLPGRVHELSNELAGMKARCEERHGR